MWNTLNSLENIDITEGKMNRTVTIGKCTVVCRNVPDNWTDKELHHYAWIQIVNMHIKKVEREVLTERARLSDKRGAVKDA